MTSAAQRTPFSFQNIFINPNQNIPSEIKSYAVRSNHLANQILAQHEPKDYTGPVVIHDYHYYHPTPFFWYNPSPRVYIVNPVRQTRREAEKDNAALLGTVAAIVGGITLYYLGASIAGYQEAGQEYDDTQNFKKKLQDISLQSINKNMTSDEKNNLYVAGQMAYWNDRICARIQNSCLIDIVLRTTLAGACGTVIAGAFMTSSPVWAGGAAAYTTAGLIAGTVTSGLMLLKWGINDTDRSNIRDAQALKETIQLLK